MIVETVITSVPRGLKAGRTGFQPVMRTRGLRDDVLRQLEPLTGYRHVHRQGSGQNPANYSYHRLASNVGDLAVLGFWQPRYLASEIQRERNANFDHLVTVGDAITPFLL